MILLLMLLKGAIGAIVNKDYDISLIEDIDIDILAVDDTLKAYQDLAHFGVNSIFL